MLSRLIQSLMVMVALTLAWSTVSTADGDKGPPQDTGMSRPLAASFGVSDPMATLPSPPEAPAPWTDRPRTLDFLMRDLAPISLDGVQGAPQADRPANRQGAVNYFVDINRLYELTPEPIDPRAPEAPTPLTPMEASQLRTRLETSGLFVDQRLALSGGMSWDRAIYDPYWAMADEPEEEVATMTYGFGADFTIDDEWTAAAALTKRESVNKRPRRTARQFSGAKRLIPSDLMMGRLGLQLIKPDWGLRARLTAYAGQIGPARYDADPDAGMADLRGLELSLQKKMLDGRLSLELAAMLNSLTTRHALQLALADGKNLSAFLGLTYTDPSLLNASVFLRHAEDGNYVNSNYMAEIGSSSFWDARVWRDFSLSSDLTLSTQLYGSSLIEAYFENLANSERNGANPYMEGRVTMSYSF